ncbi:MAG TPA: esterase [Gallionellaceae bacterium]
MPHTFHGMQLLPDRRPPRQLYILLHGEGATPSDLLPLAKRLRERYPDAAFLLPDGFQPFEGSDYRRQWYGGKDISDENLPGRVAAAIAMLHAIIKSAQDELNVLPPDTALLGYSQGATLALEYSAAHDGGVGRVISFSGRYATLPDKAPELTTLHLLHGQDNDIIPVAHAHAAYERLSSLHGDVTIDIAFGVGHELHPALIERAITRLETCVPLRSWERALGLR